MEELGLKSILCPGAYEVSLHTLEIGDNLESTYTVDMGIPAPPSCTLEMDGEGMLRQDVNLPGMTSRASPNSLGWLMPDQWLGKQKGSQSRTLFRCIQSGPRRRCPICSGQDVSQVTAQ